LASKPTSYTGWTAKASGIVLFAKNKDSHRQLCIAFETRQIQKLYLALVHGQIEKNGIIDSPIKTFGSGRMGVGSEGKPSITR